MHRIREDSIKSRLTERAELMTAVTRMMERGIPEELIPVHLARAFYVDIDELNAVLDMVRTARTPGPDGRAMHAFA